MNNAKKPKEPRPWHTKSFHLARFALCCVGCLLFGLDGFSLVFGAFCGLAFLDAMALQAWHKGSVKLPPPLIPLADIPSKSSLEKEALKLVVAYFVAAFVAACFGVVFSQPINEGSAFAVRFLAIVLLNICGWHLMQWFCEIRDLFAQYRVQATREALPIAAAYTPITPQAAPQIVSVGAGRNRP